MNLNSIKQWLASKGGLSHVVVGAYIALIALYAKAPAVASLLNTIYATLPAWSHEVILAVLGAAAFYSNNDAPTKANADAAADRAASAGNSSTIDGTTHLGLGILLILGLGLLATPARAQTFSASSDAVAFHYAGQWSVASHTTESLDFLDFGAKKTNLVFLDGHEFVAPTVGLSVYAGGISIQPDLTPLLKKTNISASNITIDFNVAAGNGIPTTGSSHVSFLGGGRVKYKATSALTWNTAQFEYVRFGPNSGWSISSGLAYVFGQ
jgi:hypothetical protein